ncbi:MAG: aldo/keto reductase [Clostridiales bacterium]|nr:aldo/keto reductase [Clostridiales bacterium]
MKNETSGFGLFPNKTLYTGVSIPNIGMGTFGSDKYGAEEVGRAVYGGIKAGYRLFDCASVYGNEREVGHSIRLAIDEGIVCRDELFIISKVWNDCHGDGKVIESCERSLRDLGLEYVDLYLVHWPFPNSHDPGCGGESRDGSARPFSAEEYMSVWRQCEELVRTGKARHIGMSNMTIKKLEAVLPMCEIKPAALEAELHPAFRQKELFEYATEHGMMPLGFCPIGSPSRPERDRTDGDICDTELPAVTAAAKAHGVHPAVICLKWAAARGQIPLPFSVKEEQYRANLQAVRSDPLTKEEFGAIESSDANCRLIKGQVFLWRGSDRWQDIWDE